MTSHSDFFSLAQDQRYSVRTYDMRPVEQEDLDAVLRAGQIAPTAANRQPQRILVINTREGMVKLAQCTRYVFGAPAALVVCYDRSSVWVRNFDDKDSGDVDASIVATHMMLEAAERGLGTCWVGHFDPVKLRELFNIPATFEPVAILDLGYPGDDAQPNPLHSRRKELAETVFYNHFDTSAQQ